MKKLSKRLKFEKTKITKAKLYNLNQALELVQKTASAKFTESIEAHIRVKTDTYAKDYQLRNSVFLPYGTGKCRKIAILTHTETNPLDLQKLGVYNVTNTDLLKEISAGIINFDILISTSEMMPHLLQFGRILGPKGLMPSTNMGTLTADVKIAIENIQKGKVNYKIDKTGNVHINFGKVTFSKHELLENFMAIYTMLNRTKPKSITGNYIKKITLCSTMGPGIHLDCNEVS